VTSGLRVGTPVGTTRGFGTDEFTNVGRMMVEVLDGLASNPHGNNATETAVKEEVISLCRRFPIYGNLSLAKM
jgi:glycine hydroxymethyltransferase